MPNPLTRTARAYGANPLHLLALLASFAVAGYAVAHLVHESTFVRILLWFLAAVIGHDLILFPLYALADRSLRAALRALWPRRGTPARVPPLQLPPGTGARRRAAVPGVPPRHPPAGPVDLPRGHRPDPAAVPGPLAAADRRDVRLSAIAYAIRLRQPRQRHPLKEDAAVGPTKTERPSSLPD